MRKFITRGAAALAAASVALSPLAARAPAAAKPALWKVADKDTIIYLFGTIHLLPGFDPHPPPLLGGARLRDPAAV